MSNNIVELKKKTTIKRKHAIDKENTLTRIRKYYYYRDIDIAAAVRSLKSDYFSKITLVVQVTNTNRLKKISIRTG